MRYSAIEDVIFTTVDGQSVTIKAMREYESYKTFAKINLKGEKTLDEIATRPEYYGDETEGESYKIADANITKLFDVQFDLDKIKILEIPL